MDHCVIDRFEGEYAICVAETRETRQIPRSELPGSAREGEHIRFQNGIWAMDEEATRKGREALRERMNKLWD